VVGGGLPGGAAIAGAPAWCIGAGCGTGVLGVGGGDGLLYAFSTPALPAVWTYPASAAVSDGVSSDGSGYWYLASSDGYFYEVQAPPAGSPVVVAERSPMGAAGPIVGAPLTQLCPTAAGTDTCVYGGSTDTSAYLYEIHHVPPTMTRYGDLQACIGSAGVCTAGRNPRVWVRVKVGGGTSGIRYWSYYSP
jgi:hypothetical protein